MIIVTTISYVLDYKLLRAAEQQRNSLALL